MRRLFELLLLWTLSPLGTLLNTGLLAAALVLAGADAHRPSFWLPVALFLGVSAFYDIGAYVAQRRKGLTSHAVAAAVVERLWPSSESEGRP